MKYRKLTIACAIVTVLAAWAAAFCWYQAVTLDNTVSDIVRTGDDAAVPGGKTVDQYLHESTETVNRYSTASLTLEAGVAVSLVGTVIFYILARRLDRRAKPQSTSAPSLQQ